VKSKEEQKAEPEVAPLVLQPPPAQAPAQQGFVLAPDDHIDEESHESSESSLGPSHEHDEDMEPLDEIPESES